MHRRTALTLLLLPAALHTAEPTRPGFRAAKTENELRNENTPAPPIHPPKGNILDGLPLERIGLPQLITMALENNLDARISAANWRVEKAGVKFAAGIFDPIFSIAASREYQETPTTTADTSSTEATQLAQISAIEQQTDSIDDNTRAVRDSINSQRTLAGLPPIDFTPLPTRTKTTALPNTPERINILERDTDRFEAALGLRTPLGTRISFSASQTKTRSTFAGDLGTVTPYWQASGSLQVRQPLLRDFGPSANLRELREAKINEQIANLTWRRRVSESVARVLAEYFETQAAFANLGVRQDAIEAGEHIRQQNQRRYQLGLMAPIDVQQSEAQVSADREALYIAKNGYLTSQFNLQRLVLPKYDPEKRRVYVPTTATHPPIPRLDRTQLMRLALTKRPDYLAAITSAQLGDIRLKFAKNQLLPQLDLIGTYGYNGLAFTDREARSQASKGRAFDWSAGIQISIPLGNIQGRANLESARAFKEQLILRVQQAELEVSVDVDTALSVLETNQQQLQSARQTRHLHEENVRLALRRLQEGQADSFQVLELQRKYYEARSRELATRALVSRAMANLWLATGDILDQTGIKLADTPAGPNHIQPKTPPHPTPKKKTPPTPQ